MNEQMKERIQEARGWENVKELCSIIDEIDAGLVLATERLNKANEMIREIVRAHELSNALSFVAAPVEEQREALDAYEKAIDAASKYVDLIDSPLSSMTAQDQ